MRSRLTWRPASRAHSTTSGTRSGSWVRSSVASTCGTADCIPNETRVKPASARRREVVGVDRVGVGLGRDLGAVGETPGVAHRAEHARQVGRPAACVGVPPPKKTVDDRAVRAARSSRARRRRTPTSRDGVAGVVALRDAAQLGRRVGVEVAVAAAHPAERHVQVDAEVALGGVLERRRRAAGRRRAPDRRAEERSARQADRTGRSARRYFAV